MRLEIIALWIRKIFKMAFLKTVSIFFKRFSQLNHANKEPQSQPEFQGNSKGIGKITVLG